MSEIGIAVTASPRLTPERTNKVLSGVGAIALILVTAVVTYFATARLNNEASVQQQYLLALQDFNRTGAALDVAITNLADAVVDERGVEAARQGARRAIAEHVGACQGLAEIVGRANMAEYAFGLSKLREYVDDTRNPRSAMLASQARFDLMHNRAIIATEARKQIYE